MLSRDYYSEICKWLKAEDREAEIDLLADYFSGKDVIEIYDITKDDLQKFLGEIVDFVLFLKQH